ncbi:13871_t:CDS:2, partial [Cetraspora pellucida]
MNEKNDINLEEIKPDYDFGKRNYKDKAKAGRLKLLKNLRDYNVLCVFLDGMVGPAIIGRYNKIYFIILVRHWSECSKSYKNRKFKEFMEIIDEIHPEFIKFYYCTLNENEHIRKEIKKYNEKYEKTMLYYVEKQDGVINKLKELNESNDFIHELKSHDVPCKKRIGIKKKLKINGILIRDERNHINKEEHILEFKE